MHAAGGSYKLQGKERKLGPNQMVAINNHKRLKITKMVEEVKLMIQSCILKSYMTKEDVVQKLKDEFGIKPSVTMQVYDMLEKDNAEFFKVYAAKLESIQHMNSFNHLARNQINQYQPISYAPQRGTYCMPNWQNPAQPIANQPSVYPMHRENMAYMNNTASSSRVANLSPLCLPAVPANRAKSGKGKAPVSKKACSKKAAAKAVGSSKDSVDFDNPFDEFSSTFNCPNLEELMKDMDDRIFRASSMTKPNKLAISPFHARPSYIPTTAMNTGKDEAPISSDQACSKEPEDDKIDSIFSDLEDLDAYPSNFNCLDVEKLLNDIDESIRRQ